MLSENIRKKFVNLYNTTPLLVRSPGRINLIGDTTGEHGMVLSAAIDRDIICAMSPNYSDICQVHAYNLRDTESFNIAKFKKSEKRWMNLILGVVDQFQKRKLEIKGFDCVFGGDIPIGAGLSSSVAISCAFAHSFNLLFEYGLSKTEIATIAWMAGKDYEVTDTGITDHFAGVFGKVNQIIRIHESTTDHEYFDFPYQEYRLILCDTGVKNPAFSVIQGDRELACDKGASILKKRYSSIESLRDVSLDQLRKHEADFEPTTFKQCKFVVEENTRVLDCCTMLKQGDMSGFGENMNKSQDGLNEAFEISRNELYFLHKKVMSSNMAIGSRMMGRDSGSNINIVKVEHVDAFSKFITEAYNAEFDLPLKIYPLKIENGTAKL